MSATYKPQEQKAREVAELRVEAVSTLLAYAKAGGFPAKYVSSAVYRAIDSIKENAEHPSGDSSRLCIDCKHCVRSESADDPPQPKDFICERKRRDDGFSLVTGDPVIKGRVQCVTARSFGSIHCGPEAFFFEPIFERQS